MFGTNNENLIDCNVLWCETDLKHIWTKVYLKKILIIQRPLGLECIYPYANIYFSPLFHIVSSCLFYK